MLRARVASLTEQVLAKNMRFAGFMRRVFEIGRPKSKHGKVRIVFVVDLEDGSTGTDADWTVSSQGVIAKGRSGETALAQLATDLEVPS